MSLLARISVTTLCLTALPISPATGEEVAKVGDRIVTRSELELHAQARLQPLESQRHQVLETALDELVAEELFALEAERRGMTLTELIEAEITSRSVVSKQDIDTFFEQNRERIKGSRESSGKQIRAYLEQQKAIAARDRLVATLEGRFPIEKGLEPFRLKIDESGAMSWGADDASVTLVEFSDFECPYCQRLAPVLERLEGAYPQALRVHFRQFPLRSIHARAQLAAEASLCAGEQGAFRRFHDRLMSQGDLDRKDLIAAAKALDLDNERFRSCLEQGEQRKAVERDIQTGLGLGVSGTPTIFVNGRPVSLAAGTDPYEQISSVIDDELVRGATP